MRALFSINESFYQCEQKMICPLLKVGPGRTLARTSGTITPEARMGLRQ